MEKYIDDLIIFLLFTVTYHNIKFIITGNQKAVPGITLIKKYVINYMKKKKT